MLFKPTNDFDQAYLLRTQTKRIENPIMLVRELYVKKL